MSRLAIALSVLCFGAVYLVHTHRAVSAVKSANAHLPAALMQIHQKSTGCVGFDELEEHSIPLADAFFHHRINKTTELYGVICEYAAYNWPFAIYIVRDGDAANAERMLFADYDIAGGWTGSDVLYNAYFDQETGELHGFSKSRGFGDCGSLSTLKWEDDRFVLLEYRYKDACDGGINTTSFPLIYKRRIIRR